MRRLEAAVLLLALPVLGQTCARAHTLSDAEKRRIVAEMYEEYKSDFADVPDVTVEELLALEDGEVVLVDVREVEERRISMIPGAISREEYEAHPEAYDGRRVVAYCTVGYRSGLWAADLRRRGVDVANLAGSLLAWTHAGGRLVDSEGETRRLHVYGRTWDLAARGYETVW